ncbi:MAG: dynamin family protein [bacterium]|nr:dynamin family protein [bacterium]
MKKVFIKYNPYNLETKVTVDGKKLAQNSKLREKITNGSRLQEWVEELPSILIDEYNDTDFDITFHGTLLDFEDLTEVFTDAYNDGKLTAKLDRKPAKETSDKETLIDDVFKEIQNGPFNELKDDEILNSFENAKNSDFEVCVVATMSAGKSTLINSMLGTKLMPSKQEACTAIITRIRDNDSNSWQAEVYDKDNNLIESHKNLDYQTMERLNSDQNVSTIKIDGDIPFVNADDMSLVLIDTPGPNNSRDPEHRRVQSEFLSKSSKSLVLYIMEGTFGSDDDNALLQRVADSMAVGGKQSKDRFIFVVNKMDDRRKEDGDTQQTLDRIRDYLRKHDIENANLFPAAALPALNIRLIRNGEKVDEDTIDETELKVRKLNRNENLHFEDFASLPSSIRGQIKNELFNSIESKDVDNQALIHTGVPSIEAAIRQYVEKYAKTSKIKNIVDTFMHKLDELKCFEETKHELASRLDESQKIAQQISNIRKKIDDGKTAKLFKDSVDEALQETRNKTIDTVEEITTKFQNRITNKIRNLEGVEVELDEVEFEIDQLSKFVKRLEPEFEDELEDLIKENLINTGNSLLEEYKNKLASMSEEINISDNLISIDPLKLMAGSVNLSTFSIEGMIKSKEVEDGEEWIENTNKKWYKPWTWFEEKGYYRTLYKTVRYVNASEMAQKFFTPIEVIMFENVDNVKDYVFKKSAKVVEDFNSKFKILDGALKEKLAELESFSSDKEKAEERVRESEQKLEWLYKIREKVQSILEI